MPFDPAFTAQRNRKRRVFTEEQLQECRDLLALNPEARNVRYQELKRIVYARESITPGQQLFLDKIDAVFRRFLKKFVRYGDLIPHIDAIKV